VDLLARYESTVQIREDQLVARCRAGDVEAFGQVYAQYERQVFRYAYHLVGHREDADDIKQETFLRAYQALPHFKGECSMLCWLLRICGNLCRDRLKSRRRHPESLADPQTTQDLWPGDARAQADPHTLLEQRQARETLRRALAAMPPAHREILVLREIEELPYDEIAEVLGCSLASVKLRLFRARRLLRQRLTALIDAR